MIQRAAPKVGLMPPPPHVASVIERTDKYDQYSSALPELVSPKK